VSYLLYPKVFEDYVKFREEYGWKVSWADTRSFFYGLRIDKPIHIYLPPDTMREDVTRVSAPSFHMA